MQARTGRLRALQDLERHTMGQLWFDAVDDMLNVVSYENIFFEIVPRLAEAEGTAERLKHESGWSVG